MRGVVGGAGRCCPATEAVTASAIAASRNGLRTRRMHSSLESRTNDFTEEGHPDMQTFAIAPSATKALWLLPVVLVPVAIGVAALLMTFLGSRGARFEISAEGLRLRGDFYGRMIPIAELRTAEARRVDLAATPELAPRWRTFGTGMPGYQAGWFRLKGGEKALLYLTDRSRAVYVPTTAGYSVMVSPADPDAFLQALESIGRR